ncbi:MAG: RAMP superfamily CRISPR-associated protein [Proteobacteria bacterium]|nr:RAMP superfamily CRISPR-associated protein [Pseudomonadota bacterium]
MLRKLVNHAEVVVVLEPAEPLLIASGIPNASGIDLPFVLTYRGAGDRGEPYLPGSSLKGVLRSHSERISRTLAPDARVCDPHFHKTDQQTHERIAFCGDWLSKPRSGEPFDSATVYRRSCPICRTFGSTACRGRLAIGDAHLGDSNACPLERRDGVGIDRFSGGASRRAKFEMQVLTRGTLQTRIRLENFEDWQLGLLALLCRDLEDEQVSIGHATTRGLGRLRGTLSRFDVSYIVPPSRQLDHTRVHGVGSLLGDSSERGPYGYRDDDGFALDGAPPTLNTRGIRRVISLADDPRVLRGFLDSAVAHWARRMDEWRVS